MALFVVDLESDSDIPNGKPPSDVISNIDELHESAQSVERAARLWRQNAVSCKASQSSSHAAATSARQLIAPLRAEVTEPSPTSASSDRRLGIPCDITEDFSTPRANFGPKAVVTHRTISRHDQGHDIDARSISQKSINPRLPRLRTHKEWLVRHAVKTQNESVSNAAWKSRCKSAPIRSSNLNSSNYTYTRENDTSPIHDFSLASLRPRLGLSETDEDFQSLYRDKKLVSLFKHSLERYLRTKLLDYEDRLPFEELQQIAFKHARRVFEQIMRAAPSDKRSLLIAGMNYGIAEGFDDKVKARLRYLRNHSVPRVRERKEPLANITTQHNGAEEDNIELEERLSSDASDVLRVASSIGMRRGSKVRHAFKEQNLFERRKRSLPINYNVKAMFKAARNGTAHTSTVSQFGKSSERSRQSPRHQRASSEFFRHPRENRALLLRNRELGYGCLGGQRDSKGIHQDLKVLVMQDMKHRNYWTGAAKDLVTASWAPNGLTYALGSSTDMDDLNIQYNRPNNLLIGNILNDTILELPDHHVDRPRPDTISSGDNAWVETYNAVDPRLFTTVTSICYNHTSTRLYTGSYDRTVKIWDLKQTPRPNCISTLRHDEYVTLVHLSIDSKFLATAQHSHQKPIQVFTATDEPEQLFEFYPERTKNDLYLYPSVLRWGNLDHSRHLLLAGFMENKSNANERDREGYIGIWDIASGSEHQIRVSPCTQAIFDLAWSPHAPHFAAASTTGNPTKLTDRWCTKSLVRIYSPLVSPSCQQEYECPAIDINEVCFHPVNEHYLSASCTDGVTYIWDDRNPSRILHKLCHGEPLDPLNYYSRDVTARAREREDLDTGVRFVSWDEYGSNLYTGSSDSIVKSWNILTSPEDVFIKNIAEFDSNIMTGQFSPDFSNLLIGLSKGCVNLLSCASTESPQNISDDPIISVDQCQPLAYISASNEASDNNEGISASQSLVSSGEICVHPIFGAGQGFAYEGPFSRFARKGVAEDKLPSTDLDPDWLVKQLHPQRREIGYSHGADPSEVDREDWHKGNAISWARYQKFHPDTWQEILTRNNSHGQIIALNSVLNGDKIVQADSIFWREDSATSSPCSSQPHSEVVHEQNYDDLDVKADPYLRQDIPYEVNEPNATFAQAQASFPPQGIQTKLSSLHTPSMTDENSPNWIGSSPRPATWRERREKERAQARNEAHVASQKGKLIELDRE